MSEAQNDVAIELEMLRLDASALRDHDVALELYVQAERIEAAHPLVAELVQRAAELLLRINEYRVEGIRLALDHSTSLMS